MFSPRTMHRITALTEKEEDLSQMLDRVREGALACAGREGRAEAAVRIADCMLLTPPPHAAPAASRPGDFGEQGAKLFNDGQFVESQRMFKVRGPPATAPLAPALTVPLALSAFWTSPACFFPGVTACSGSRSAPRCSGR